MDNINKGINQQNMFQNKNEIFFQNQPLLTSQNLLNKSNNFIFNNSISSSNIPMNMNNFQTTPTNSLLSSNTLNNNFLRAPKLFETICQIMSTSPLKHWSYKELRLILNSPPYKGKIYDHNKNQFYDLINDRNVYICLGKKKDTFEVNIFFYLKER
jgi:hypothetical protein